MENIIRPRDGWVKMIWLQEADEIQELWRCEDLGEKKQQQTNSKNKNKKVSRPLEKKNNTRPLLGKCVDEQVWVWVMHTGVMKRLVLVNRWDTKGRRRLALFLFSRGITSLRAFSQGSTCAGGAAHLR